MDQTTLSQSQISAVMQLLTSVRRDDKRRTLTDLYPIRPHEVPGMQQEIRRLTGTAEYQDAGFDLEHPKCFGNLCRYALVRKSRQGVSIEAQGHLWRRVLRDCSGWPTDSQGFRRELDGYLSRLEGERSERTGRRLSPQSHNNLLGLLQSIWSVGVSIDLADANPMTSDRYPRKRTKPRKRTLTDSEISGMLHVLQVQHEGLYWAFLFCLKNPIGYGDVRRLRCRDVDLEAGTISYARRKTSQPACPLIYPELSDYCRRRVVEGHELLFDLPHDYRWAWRRALEQSGTTDLTWHDLRHHAATWLARQGVPLHIIASIGGWASVQMVERYHDLRGESAAQYARAMLCSAAA